MISVMIILIGLVLLVRLFKPLHLDGRGKMMSANEAASIAKRWTLDRGEQFLTQVKSYRAGIKGLVAELRSKEKVPA